MFSALRRWRRRRQADRMSVSAAQWEQVEQSLPFLAWRPAEDRPMLRRMALEFLAEKQVHGARGLAISDEMLLSIALQACLPVLHIGLDAYADWVGIVVYPGDFVIPRRMIDEDGVVHEYDDEVMGEAWYGGPVLISWFDQPQDADGINVVIHEFAHKLDMKSGDADGMPPLHEGMSRKRWAAVMKTAFEDFQRRVDSGEETAIDPYAAELPTEFFAVTSEVFFEDPHLLNDEYPEVYEQLRLFYRQDPAKLARTRFRN